MRDFDVHACTDVTGFSLLGHAYEMAHGSDVELVIQSTSLPLLPGARELAKSGISTGGCQRNRDWLADKVTIAPSVPADLIEIAHDPQTSGGLLFAVAERDADRALETLHQAVPTSRSIGHVVAKASLAGTWVRLT